MMNFRTKTIYVDAIILERSRDSIVEIFNFIFGEDDYIKQYSSEDILKVIEKESLTIFTVKGLVTINFGDFVTKDADGLINTFSPDVFHKIYEVNDKSEIVNRSVEFNNLTVAYLMKKACDDLSKLGCIKIINKK